MASMAYRSYRTFGAAHDTLALQALRRTAGGPVTTGLVKSLFVELLGHDGDCAVFPALVDRPGVCCPRRVRRPRGRQERSREVEYDGVDVRPLHRLGGRPMTEKTCSCDEQGIPCPDSPHSRRSTEASIRERRRSYAERAAQTANRSTQDDDE